MGIQATDCNQQTKLWVLFKKTGFFTQCLRSVSHRPISQENKREQQTQQQWIQQVVGNPPGKDLQTKLRKNEDVDFKFSASNGTAKANTVN